MENLGLNTTTASAASSNFDVLNRPLLGGNDDGLSLLGSGSTIRKIYRRPLFSFSFVNPLVAKANKSDGSDAQQLLLDVQQGQPGNVQESRSSKAETAAMCVAAVCCLALLVYLIVFLLASFGQLHIPCVSSSALSSALSTTGYILPAVVVAVTVSAALVRKCV